MTKLFQGLALMLICVGTSLGQHGSASGGYYPPGYSGDTWSGTVTTVNPETREITLTYNHQGKDETFTGILRPGYKKTLKDGRTIDVQVQQIPIGSHMVAYYSPKTKKENGQKIKFNEIFDFTLAAATAQK